jgi:tetratricopeptide (TPR) repeat protein
MSADSSPDVFLSSAFRQFMDVRERIRALDPTRVWAVEVDRTDLDQRKGASPFFIVDQLIAQIRRSPLFICVLRDVYGSSVFGQTESVSFLEAEIYQAALFHNNVRFFLMEPFNPEGKLKGLLELIRALRPGLIPDRVQTEAEILDEIKRALDTTPSRRRPWTLPIKNFVGGLAIQRGHPLPDIEFFDKVFRPVSATPDRDHIKILLGGLAGESSIEKRLTRTWIALRELCAAPYDDPKFSEFLPLWDEVLGVWSSAAAWYGLHGHLYAGRLAAVNSVLAIRQRLGPAGVAKTPSFIQGTKGARASEYYSMAKILPDRTQRAAYLNLAMQNIDEALATLQGERAGYLAIRGHIHLAQGKPRKALADFVAVREEKEAAGDAGGAGEALGDIGLVELRLGHVLKARRLLEEGAARLDAAGSVTFALRVRKRLAQAYLLSGHPMRALRQLADVHARAERDQIFDQISPATAFAHRMIAARKGRA